MGVLSHMPLVVLLALLSVFFLAAFTQAVHALSGACIVYRYAA